MEQRVAQLESDLAERTAQANELESKLNVTEALLRYREDMLFGRKSEKKTPPGEVISESESVPDGPDDTLFVDKPAEPKRKRGAQEGHRGNGRKIPENLPVRTQIHEVPPEMRVCPRCGKPLETSGLCEESHEISVEMIAYVVKHLRERMFRTCDCENLPKSVTAPPPPKVVPKSMYSHGFLALVLTFKYGFQLPLHRTATMFSLIGLHVNEGTLCGVFKRLTTILNPLYEALQNELQNEERVHADETGFFRFGAPMEFSEVESTPRKRCWLWVFRGERVVFFVFDESRSSSVPLAVLGTDMVATLISDHFSAYVKLLKAVPGLQQALCWVHFRRFFEKSAVSYPELRDWADQWIDRIGVIYHLNHQRLEAVGQPLLYADAQARLETALQEFHAALLTEQTTPGIHEKQFQVLTTATKNWAGYTLFVTDHRIPMDNNPAEQALRANALARHNWHGVHADWSGQFAAMMMTFIQTATQHDLNPTAYLCYVLDRFAEFAGNPRNLQELFPWNIPETALQSYSMIPGRGDSP